MLAGALLAPVLAVVAFNIVIFVVVLSVLIKHSKKKIQRAKASADGSSKEATIRLLISIFSIMNMYGLTWIFAILAFTQATFAFQLLFAIFNSLQGFFMFLFFCVLGKEARDSWTTLLCRGKLKRFGPTTSNSRPGAHHSSSAQTNTNPRRYSAQTTETLMRSSGLASSQARRSSYSVETLRSLSSSRAEISEEPSSVSIHEEPSSSVPDLIEINNQALALDTLERTNIGRILTPMLTLHEESEEEENDLNVSVSDIDDLESVSLGRQSNNTYSHSATPMITVVDDSGDGKSQENDSNSLSGGSFAESGIMVDDDISPFEASLSPSQYQQQLRDTENQSSPTEISKQPVSGRSQQADGHNSEDESEVLQNPHAR